MGVRTIGETGIRVTPVAMGCWPIAGITSIDVNEKESIRTLETAFETGINFFDTATMYGYNGESEKLIARAFGHRRDEIVIATKGGLSWKNQQRHFDGRPETIKRQCEESLQRLRTDYVELYYLHAPDPKVSISDSAGALVELLDEGKIRSAGVSNCSVGQLEEFSAVCPLSAFQPHFNMLPQEIVDSQLPWCVERNVSVMVYWPLMKGLLAGKLPRDHVFDPKDGRQKYPMFHGDEWQKNHDFLDKLRPIAREVGTTVAQVVINWTFHFPGICVALCGAKRPDQIRDNAEAMTWKLTDEQRSRIDQAIIERGAIVSQAAV